MPHSTALVFLTSVHGVVNPDVRVLFIFFRYAPACGYSLVILEVVQGYDMEVGNTIRLVNNHSYPPKDKGHLMCPATGR